LAQRPGTQASLFVTCIIDQLYPEVGASVVRVLRKLGVKVDFPQDQTCCGQPLYNSGFTRQARQLAHRVIKSFGSSEYVVVPSGSCAAMMRVFYLDLLEDDPHFGQPARQLASRVYEFSEFLVDVLGVEDVGAVYPGTVTYHPSCHLLRELEVREAPGKLLGKVSGLELLDLPREENCCGFGGAFSVKYPHISQDMVADKVSDVTSTGANTLVSCDMGCLMNIGGALGRQGHNIKIRHLAQLLDQEGV
jgi:L-lactate dehydrogenase complex protein LldE